MTAKDRLKKLSEHTRDVALESAADAMAMQRMATVFEMLALALNEEACGQFLEDIKNEWPMAKPRGDA